MANSTPSPCCRPNRSSGSGRIPTPAAVGRSAVGSATRVMRTSARVVGSSAGTLAGRTSAGSLEALNRCSEFLQLRTQPADVRDRFIHPAAKLVELVRRRGGGGGGRRRGTDFFRARGAGILRLEPFQLIRRIETVRQDGPAAMLRR